jgi:glutaredoxin
VTLPELRAALEWEEVELEAKEKTELEKAAKEKADSTVCTLRINQEIASRFFDHPLASYKRNDGLIALAGSLALSMECTVVELVKAIKNYVAENPGRANEPRFSGLFGGSRERTAAMDSSSESSVDPSTPPLLVFSLNK